MAAEVPEAGIVAFCIAAGCAKILEPFVYFLERAPNRGPVLDAAVPFVFLTVAMAFLDRVIPLLYLHVTLATGTPVVMAPGTPVVMATSQQFVLLVFALLFVASLFRDPFRRRYRRRQ